MENTNAIQVKGLVKSYGKLKAVDGVDFSVKMGEICSLLGPNGAGKSTTISMLSGLLLPDQGEAEIMGYSIVKHPNESKAQLGIVPQDIALYPDLSARENLVFWGKMYGLRGAILKKRVDEVLDIIGLSSRQKDRVGAYSGGMKRRVNIGAALLHQPKVVIMDEPTVGIDPQSRRHILDNVKELNRQGMTVLYTTHYMEEAQELSNHIAIIDQGKIVAYGTHQELIRLVGEHSRIALTVNVEHEKILPLWQSVEGVLQISTIESKIILIAQDSNQVLPHLFELTSGIQARITSVDIQEPDLEAVFLHLTGRALRD